MDALKRVSAARTAMLLEDALSFFGTLSLRLKLKPDDSAATAWTDGASIGFNPQFIDGLTQPEVLGTVAHEVLHCSNAHPWRRDGRDPRRWNEACDYAINGVLLAAGFTLPEGCLHNPEWDGKAAEWVYDRLTPPPPEDSEGEPEDGDGSEDGSEDSDGSESGSEPEDGTEDGDGSGDADGDADADPVPGEVRDAPEDEGEPTEAEWKQATREAATIAAGSMEGDLERHVERATETRVDWRSVLRRFISETATADYTWTRPNSRYVAAGMFLPSLHSEAMPPIVIAIDTSGSIDKVALAQFAAELDAVVSEAQPNRVHVISCDTAVRSCDTFEQGEPLDMTPKGGGGTDFRPVFDAVEDLDEPPCCVIYLTDLYGPFPEVEPEVPVLWACTSREVAPFGETVRLES